MGFLDNNNLSRVWNKMKAWIQTQLPTDFNGATTASAGTHGLVPAPETTDVDKFLRGDGSWVEGGKPMVVLSYGNSTWDDFIEAYNNNVIVYCRASSNANPATGNQTRMAFMAYVNANPPTEVEFQYYRSVSSHSDSQQGDQVFIYKLTKTGGWSVTTRNSFTKIVAGSNMTSNYSNGALTLNATGGGTDEKVTQTESTADKNYEVLVSGTASTATTTEGVNKNKSFRYNPYKNAVMEGNNTIASGQGSHAEGGASTASGYYAHAEGDYTLAQGVASHAEGGYTYAKGIFSHAEGNYTTATHDFQHVFGSYNEVDGNESTTTGTYIEIVGNGKREKDPDTQEWGTTYSNARTLDWSGNEVLSGKLTVGAAPTNNMDVATKQYVDTAVTAAIAQVLAAQY